MSRLLAKTTQQAAAPPPPTPPPPLPTIYPDPHHALVYMLRGSTDRIQFLLGLTNVSRFGVPPTEVRVQFRTEFKVQSQLQATVSWVCGRLSAEGVESKQILEQIEREMKLMEESDAQLDEAAVAGGGAFSIAKRRRITTAPEVAVGGGEQTPESVRFYRFEGTYDQEAVEQAAQRMGEQPQWQQRPNGQYQIQLQQTNAVINHYRTKGTLTVQGKETDKAAKKLQTALQQTT